jgi:hypothetical protein
MPGIPNEQHRLLAVLYQRRNGVRKKIVPIKLRGTKRPLRSPLYWITNEIG